MFYLGEKGEPGLSGQPGSDGLPGPDVMNCFCGNKKKLNFFILFKGIPGRDGYSGLPGRKGEVGEMIGADSIKGKYAYLKKMLYVIFSIKDVEDHLVNLVLKVIMVMLVNLV